MQFVAQYYSIEHHQGWYDDMKALVAEQRPNVHYFLAQVPDGHKGWNGGYEEGSYDQFKEYVQAVDQFGVSFWLCCLGSAACLRSRLVAVSRFARIINNL